MLAKKTDDVVKEDEPSSPQEETDSSPPLSEEAAPFPVLTEFNRDTTYPKEDVTESRNSGVFASSPDVTSPEVNVDADNRKEASDTCDATTSQETSDPVAVQESIGRAIDEISNAVEATDLPATTVPTAEAVLLTLTENPIRTTVLQAVTNVERGIKIKDSIVKSDSTDSAFEATEELEDDGHENTCEQSALSVHMDRSVIVQENCDKKVEDISSDLS